MSAFLTNAMIEIFKVANGFIIYTAEDKGMVFIEDLDIGKLFWEKAPDDEDMVFLKKVVSCWEDTQKISCIKFVRRYASNNNITELIGLREAKEFVERWANWFYINDRGERIPYDQNA